MPSFGACSFSNSCYGSPCFVDLTKKHPKNYLRIETDKDDHDRFEEHQIQGSYHSRN